MLLEEFRSEFILDCRIRNLSERTVETYELNISLFLRWLEKEMKVNELSALNKNHFKMYVVHLQREQYQASYINLLMKCLKSFFNYLVEEEYVSVNYPKQIKVLKEEQKVIDTFSDKQVKKLIHYYNKSDYLSVRNKLIIMLFVDTGIRCTELRQIKTDFVFDNYIKLHGKGNKWRVVPISSSLQKQLLKYDRMKNTYFTSRQITIKDDTLLLTRSGEKIKSNVAIEKIISDASIGIEGVSDVRCSPHTLRHYFAKTSIKNGQDMFTLSKLLGHSNIKITQRYLESMNSDEIVEKGLRTSPLSK